MWDGWTDPYLREEARIEVVPLIAGTIISDPGPQHHYTSTSTPSRYSSTYHPSPFFYFIFF